MNPAKTVHSIAVVVPVYLGEQTLSELVGELQTLQKISSSPMNHQFRVNEIILVHDCGPDRSDEVIRQLAEASRIVIPVWLSRNFGQHAATLAGLAASSADWVATLDEDGQHNPNDLGILLDQAITTRSNLVYAEPIASTSHNLIRNSTSRIAKRLASILSGSSTPLMFSSFRLVSGEIARSVAAFSGPSVYLDVALSWITQSTTSVAVEFRDERRPRSGYSTRKLLGHFWKLAVTTGTRPLRLVSAVGAATGIIGFLLAARIIYDKVFNGIAAQGWASVFVGILILGGAVLFAVGIIAEYLGLVVRSSLGQPTYLTIRDPKSSPVHGRGSDQ